MNIEVDTPRKMSQNAIRRLFPGVRGEVAMVIFGLYLGIVLYYSRRVPWSWMGLGVLAFTAFYLAYSLKHINPTSASALHITRKRVGVYVFIGLLLILPGWFYNSLCSYLLGDGWLSFGIASSPPLILSILAVAISEEVFFRGYVLGRLKSLGGNRWARIVLVCALFIFYKVLIHSWEGWPLADYAEFFALGVVEMLFETFWVDWTGSIVTPIVIHIGWDLIVFHGYTSLPYWAL